MQAYSKSDCGASEALSDPQPDFGQCLERLVQRCGGPSMANSVNPASILRLAVKARAYDRANHDVCVKPVATLNYAIDQYSESADPQTIELDASTSLQSLQKTDLDLQGPPSNAPVPIIPSANVRITVLQAAESSCLTHRLQPVVGPAAAIGAAASIPEGVYTEA